MRRPSIRAEACSSGSEHLNSTIGELVSPATREPAHAGGGHARYHPRSPRNHWTTTGMRDVALVVYSGDVLWCIQTAVELAHLPGDCTGMLQFSTHVVSRNHLRANSCASARTASSCRTPDTADNNQSDGARSQVVSAMSMCRAHRRPHPALSRAYAVDFRPDYRAVGDVEILKGTSVASPARRRYSSRKESARSFRPKNSRSMARKAASSMMSTQRR